jgi:hypothetical protein
MHLAVEAPEILSGKSGREPRESAGNVTEITECVAQAAVSHVTRVLYHFIFSGT